MADYDLQYQDNYIDVLLATANELKTAGYIYKCVATPSTNPGTPTERVAYLASEPGTYTNFGGIVIASGLYSLTYASGTWTGTQMSAGSDIEVVQTTGQSTSDVMSQKAVTDEMKELRHPIGAKEEKRVFAQTFGNFELFADGLPVVFKYSKTKEIVAVLINNKGAQTSNGEIIASLWEDEGDPKVKASYLSNLRQDLQNTLSDLKLNDIIIKQRGSMAIAAERIECDLFEWLKKKKASKKL